MLIYQNNDKKSSPFAKRHLDTSIPGEDTEPRSRIYNELARVTTSKK